MSSPQFESLMGREKGINEKGKPSIVHQSRFFVKEGPVLKKARNRFQNLKA